MISLSLSLSLYVYLFSRFFIPSSIGIVILPLCQPAFCLPELYLVCLLYVVVFLSLIIKARIVHFVTYSQDVWSKIVMGLQILRLNSALLGTYCIQFLVIDNDVNYYK